MKIGATNEFISKILGEEKAIEVLSSAGFDSIDFSFISSDFLCNGKLFSEYTDEEFDNYFINIKKILDKNNIIAGQTHALTGPFRVTTTEEYFNKTIRCIRATAILGSSYTVIHPLILPSYKYDDNKEECKKYNIDFFSRLIPYLEKYDVKNGFENMFAWAPVRTKENQYCPTVCSRPEEIIDYIETLNSDRFVACLDLGHINLTCKDTNDSVEDAILKLRKYLKIIHVSDNDGFEDLHVPSFMGNMDWIKILNALKEANYEGIFNYEVGSNYYEKFGRDNIQNSADYMYQTGKFLTKIIEK